MMTFTGMATHREARRRRRPTMSVETVNPSSIFNYVLIFPGGRSRQRVPRASLVIGAIQHLSS
jgi:hypothetical protein